MSVQKLPGSAAARHGSGDADLTVMIAAAAPDQAHAVISQLPAPARVLYRAVWKPRFNRTSRW
jgi:hypothetical protein